MDKIAMIGVPLETVSSYDQPSITYCSNGITDPTRDALLKRFSAEIKDLGEMKIGPAGRELKMENLEKARLELLQLKKEYGLLLAIGPSHLGAIVLYEDEDIVARLDYHADFLGFPPKNICFGYASYMDWVKDRIKRPEITNYFVAASAEGKAYGWLASGIGDKRYTRANHFDIDVDCIDPSYRIQSKYRHLNGNSKISPSDVVSMVKEAKPKKLGIWEYRPEEDFRQAGLEFMINTINAAVDN